MKPATDDIQRKSDEILKKLRLQRISAKIVLIGLKVLYVIALIYLIFLTIIIWVYA